MSGSSPPLHRVWEWCARVIRGSPSSQAKCWQTGKGARSRVFELSECFVDEFRVEDVGARFRERVAYHPTCHLLRGLELGDRPLALLNAVEGLDG